MAASKGNVVFDVVGTLVGYERMFRATDERLGDRLRAEGIKPVLLCQMWLEMDEGYKKLQMRPGARGCIEKLREAGITVWALTAADPSDCAAYFQQAGIDFPYDTLLSCDTSGIGKPDPKSYKPLFNKLSAGTQPRPFMAAAHTYVGYERCNEGQVSTGILHGI